MKRSLVVRRCRDSNWTRLMSPSRMALPIMFWVGLLGPSVGAYYGGDGSFQNPYQLAGAEDVITLSQSPKDFDKHFLMVGDIDMSDYLFHGTVIAAVDNPLLSGGGFSGTFNGNGHVIKNLKISGEKYVGLFGALTELGQIYGLGIVDANVTATGKTVGMLVGYCDGSISNCFCVGRIRGQSSVGGLVGDFHGGKVVNCYSCGSVQGERLIGGLVGGEWSGIHGAIDCCYSACTVIGESVGSTIIQKGGLFGTNSILPPHSYWDAQVSGIEGENGLETTRMMDINTYLDAGWDFFGEVANGNRETWMMPAEGGYPILSVFQGVRRPWYTETGNATGLWSLSQDPSEILWNAPDIFSVEWKRAKLSQITRNLASYPQHGVTAADASICITGELRIHDSNNLIGLDPYQSFTCQAFDEQERPVKLWDVAGPLETWHTWDMMPSTPRSFAIQLHLDPNQPTPASLSQVDFFIYALYARPLMVVDVPFRASTIWRDIAPGFRVKIEKAVSKDNICQYEITEECTSGELRTGFLAENETVSVLGRDGKTHTGHIEDMSLIYNIEFIDAQGEATSYTSGSSGCGIAPSTVTRHGNWSECSGISFLRYTLALQPQKRIVPLTLYDIPITPY